MKEEHIGDGKKKFYHYTDEGKHVENWLDSARIYYQTYAGFHFLDLNSKIITTIVNSKDKYDRMDLYNKKVSFERDGLIYLPFYIEEVLTPEKRNKVYSYIRESLYSEFHDIYRYTGQEVKEYSKENLVVKELLRTEYNLFAKENLINDDSHFDRAFGVYSEEDLLFAISFTGKAKTLTVKTFGCKNNILLKDCEEPISEVLLQKVIKHIQDETDFRASNFDVDYRLLNISVERMKQYLEDLNFEFFDFTEVHSITREKTQLEKEMEGIQKDKVSYVTQYDCGNFKFVWKRPKSEKVKEVSSNS